MLLKKYKHFEQEYTDISFYCNGLYVVHGLNASGKTTFVRHIAFSCPFNTSYVSQEIIGTSVMIKDYLLDYEIKSIPDEMVVGFGLDEINFNSKLSQLSGGQRVKLAIVRTILSNREILIFDEPTNNLDQDSIIYFYEILNKLKLKHKCIVVTHSQALINMATTTILLTNKQITIKEKEIITLKTDNYNITSLSKARIMKSYILNPYFLLKISAFILLLSMLSLVSYVVLMLDYNTEEITKLSDTITISSDYDACDDNYYVFKNYNINAECSNISAEFTYASVKELAAINSVEKIYYENPINLLKLTNELFEAKEIQLLDISVPRDFYDNVTLYNSCKSNTLLMGNLPKSENEIVVSTPQLEQIFGISSVNEGLLSNVSYKNRSYIISGRTSSPVACSHYNPADVNNIYQEFDHDTFDNQVKEIQKNELVADTIYALAPSKVLVQTNKGSQKQVEIEILSKYPSLTTESRASDIAHKYEYNKQRVVDYSKINLVLLIFIGVVYVGICYNSNIILNGLKLQLFDRSLEKFAIKKGIFIAELGLTFLCLIIIITIFIVFDYTFLSVITILNYLVLQMINFFTGKRVNYVYNNN